MSKGKRTSDQRSQVRTNDLLRTDIFPKLILIKTILDQRRPDASTIERLGRLIPQPLRATIYDPRQRQRSLQSNIKRTELYKGQRSLFNQKVVKKTLCQRRSSRREQLFAMGIAGSGQRRSPGQGGSYKRTPNSKISC